MTRRVVLIGLALIFAAVRVAGFKEVHVGPVDVFQPHAHIFVGLLLGMWWGSGPTSTCRHWLAPLHLTWLSRRDPFAFRLAAALTAVELACFLLGVGGRS